jgi:XTP/dITP diphosphohydrolase
MEDLSMEFVLATKNNGKLKEITEIFSGAADITFTSLASHPGAPEVEENGATFSENSLLKARAICAYTGRPALADDSGLVVDALGGRPGVLSARYGGPGASDSDRCLKILGEMKSISSGRSARFVCVTALVLPDGREFTAEGSVEGVIFHSMRGTGGFGYDPIFYIPSMGLTFAELTPEEKNKISHRGRALQKMRAIILSL